MKGPGQCVLRDHGDEDFQADMPSYAGRHSFEWPGVSLGRAAR